MLSDLSALNGALSAQAPHPPCESPEFLENEIDTMMSAFRALNPRRADDRDTWIRVGASLKSASYHDLRANFHEFHRWSKQSPKYKSEDECHRLWVDLKGTSPDVIIRMAREDGWRPHSEKPEIIITTREERVVSDVIAALAKRENLYQRAGCLVSVTTSAPVPKGIARDPSPPCIQVVTKPALREHIAASANLVRETKDGNKPAHPTEWLVSQVDARDSYHNPTIEAISEVPVLRSDGTVIREHGFDKQTGIYFAPSCEFPIVGPEEARDALLDLISDFPWKSDSDKAAWFAATLTPLARPAYRGSSPLMVFDANTPGAGKGLLVGASSIISTGRAMAIMSAPESDAECRKRLTSLLMAGEPTCCIDNVVGKLAFPSLDAALTGETWSDRILGVNKTVRLPIRMIFYATGNNIVLHRDTFRRVNYARLEATENPETRCGFKYPNLLNHVREKRGYYTACALAILQGYCRDRRPDMGLPPLGSFEGWSDLVRSAVVWCGLPDPMNTRATLAESDDDTALLRQLIAGWREADVTGGMTAAEAVARGETAPTLYAAIQELGGSNPKHTLGLKLRTYKGRVCNGECFAKCERGKTSVWKVVRCNA